MMGSCGLYWGSIFLGRLGESSGMKNKCFYWETRRLLAESNLTKVKTSCSDSRESFINKVIVTSLSLCAFRTMTKFNERAEQGKGSVTDKKVIEGERVFLSSDRKTDLGTKVYRHSMGLVTLTRTIPVKRNSWQWIAPQRVQLLHCSRKYERVDVTEKGWYISNVSTMHRDLDS